MVNIHGLFIPTPGPGGLARRLLEDFEAGDLVVFAPPLLPLEIVNVAAYVSIAEAAPVPLVTADQEILRLAPAVAAPLSASC